MVYLRMSGENELENTRQEKSGTICLAGTKRPLLLSQRFWESDLCVFNWLDSFLFLFVLHMRTFLWRWIYLSLHISILRPKELLRSWEGYSIAATMGAGGLLQVETRHASTPFPANRVFSCSPSNCAVRGTGKIRYLVDGGRDLAVLRSFVSQRSSVFESKAR